MNPLVFLEKTISELKKKNREIRVFCRKTKHTGYFMKKITRSTKVPFGAPGSKGRQICEISEDFLNWMVRKLMDSDRHAWAIAARKELQDRKEGKLQQKAEADLENDADAFLRKHNIDPKSFR